MGLPAGKAYYRCDRRVNAAQFILLTKMRTFRSPDYYNRGTNAAYSRVGLEKLSADLQRIGRNQIVSTRIMFRIDGLGRDQSVTSLIRHNGDRMPPRLKICPIDVLNDARYSKIIDASRRFVFRVSFQDTIRNFGSQQVVAQSRQGLLMFGGRQISFRKFQRTFRNYRPRELRGFRFYRREMRGASAALEQEKGEATSGDHLPPVLET